MTGSIPLCDPRAQDQPASKKVFSHAVGKPTVLPQATSLLQHKIQNQEMERYCTTTPAKSSFSNCSAVRRQLLILGDRYHVSPFEENEYLNEQSHKPQHPDV